MDDKIFNWSNNSIFNQGQYADKKIQEIELMNIGDIQKTEENKELKL